MQLGWKMSIKFINPQPPTDEAIGEYYSGEIQSLDDAMAQRILMQAGGKIDVAVAAAQAQGYTR